MASPQTCGFLREPNIIRRQLIRETRSLVGIAGKLTFPRRQRDVDGKIGYFRGIREIATQTQLLASKACSARADKCSRSSFSGRPTERETS
jgi:hypothetical protein